MLIINALSSDTLSNVLFGLHSLLWAACVPVRADSVLVSFCPVALASRPRRGASVWGPRDAAVAAWGRCEPWGPAVELGSR